jgi:hypothetical protein
VSYNTTSCDMFYMIQLTLNKSKSLYSKFRVSRTISKVPSNFLLYLCILTPLRSNFDLSRFLFSRKENLVPSIKVQHIFISISRSVKTADWSKVGDIKVRCCHSWFTRFIVILIADQHVLLTRRKGGFNRFQDLIGFNS